MPAKGKNNEQQILEAAEVEFLERGYTNARTTDIARRAGVTHAMLHYYYRTKDKLFAMVFESKAEELISTLLFSFDQPLPFLQKLRRSIELHFDMVAANPRLPYFIFNEIMTNEERKQALFAQLRPKVERLLERIVQELDEEVAKGAIRAVAPADLMLDILSLNVFFFMAHPIVSGMLGLDERQHAVLLRHRRQHNVDLIMDYLTKPAAAPQHTHFF
jgi:AcrR family transcriptional regulator